MQGMNAETGKLLEGDLHLEQSLANIMQTLVGSLVLDRGYGSDLPLLKDKKLTSGVVMDFTVAVASAVRLWEPRILLRRVNITLEGENKIFIDLQGDERDIVSNEIISTDFSTQILVT